jgi:ABC-type dipeptide/oligopeptide/nickel transport system permease component
MGIMSCVIKRMLWMVPTLLGVGVIMFCLTILIPGDPALLRLGNFATVEQLQQLHTEMGLDKPPHERYWLYLQGLVQGDLGRSWRTGDTVTNDLKARFPATLELGLYSTILSILLGIPIGIVAAARKDSYLDYGGKLYGVLGVAMPLFWLGLILVYVFYYLLGIAPAPTGRIDMLIDPPPSITGLYVVDSLLSGDLDGLWSSITHLVLPVMTLTFIVAASIARMTYTSMRRVLSAPYILVGHAYGISPHRLVYKYALKNALMPVITFVGLQIGFLIGGVVLVEVVFALPGIGRYAVDSLLVNDFAPVQGFVLVVLIVYLCVNLLADVLYSLVNPQVRAAMEEA